MPSRGSRSEVSSEYFVETTKTFWGLRQMFEVTWTSSVGLALCPVIVQNKARGYVAYVFYFSVHKKIRIRCNYNRVV